VTERRSLAIPLARVTSNPDGGELRRTLAWGDRFDVEEVTSEAIRVTTVSYNDQPDGSVTPDRLQGWIRLRKSVSKDDVLGDEDHRILSVDYVDVQQGDAALIQTPQRHRMIIDGGQNQLFARYLANRFPWGGSEIPRPPIRQPLTVDAIVVTHGDADHFAGLPLILKSETDKRPGKSIWIQPKAIFHNGLVKGPDALGDDVLGVVRTADANQTRWLTQLVDDPRDLRPAGTNEGFVTWCDTIDTYASRAPLTVKRLHRDSTESFQTFADDGLKVEVLAPIERDVVIDGKSVKALPFLGSPAKTINGHSVMLRLTYGACRFLFTGDLNEKAANLHLPDPDGKLRAEVLKSPHHGSADFSTDFLGAVSPIVSVVSSGDEQARFEYVHPRATFMGALGRYSRVARPLVFVTELVAFFNIEGFVGPDWHRMRPDPIPYTGDAGVGPVDVPDRGRFFAFSRRAWGTVRIRTDGQKILVWTDSALARLKEAYLVDLTTDPAKVESVSPI